MYLKIFVVICTVIFTVAAHRPCPTNHECVTVDRCPIIRDVILNAPKPLPTGVLQRLQRSTCGKINNKHAVCCSNPLHEIQKASSAHIDTNFQNHPNFELLPNLDCRSKTKSIVEGEKTHLEEFPWMALLRYQTSEGLKYLCAGSIINNRYILTAAHCISGLTSLTKIHSVVLGEYNIDTRTDCVKTQFGTKVCKPPTQEFLIEKIIPHAHFNKPYLSNDIGLLRLASEINFNQVHIRPVCLPVTPELLSYNVSRVVVTGWGRTELLLPSSILLKGEMIVRNLDICRSEFPGVKITDKHFCAQGDGIMASCKGDSGGPLVFTTEFGNRGYQFGIVSGGVKYCGISSAKPSLYIRTQNYIGWILDNISRH